MAALRRYRCAATLTGHTNGARRRRPVDTTRRSLVDAARGAGLLRRRAVERPRHFRGGQQAQGVGPVERRLPPDADRAHGLRAAPASGRTAHRSLVDAATGAGLLRRRPAARQRRVRVERPHAQGVERVEQRVPPDAERAHVPGAAPGSSLTRRVRSLVDAATGAGLVRRRPVERPRRVRVVRQHAQGVGRDERSVPPYAERAHVLGAAPTSSRHNASIARRRRDGRRSNASSPSCRTAASCPGRATSRSRCGTCRAVSASIR